MPSPAIARCRSVWRALARWSSRLQRMQPAISCLAASFPPGSGSRRSRLRCLERWTLRHKQREAREATSLPWNWCVRCRRGSQIAFQTGPGDIALPACRAQVDVGANTGWFTFAAAVNGHSVRAYEPFRQNANLMRLTACLNPDAARRVQLQLLGLGNETKTCYVVSETRINLGDGHTVCDPPHDINNLPPGYHVIGRTAVQQLDTLWHDDASIAVFKMDTEGYEPFVFKGATALFASSRAPRTIFMEFFPRLMRDRHAEPAEVLRFLRQCGYSCDMGALDGDPDAYVANLGDGAVDLRCEKKTL